MQKAIWERGTIRMNRLVKLNQTSQHYIRKKAAFRTKQFIKLIWLSNVTFVREIAIKGPFRSVCLIIPSGLRLKEWSVVGLQCYSLEKVLKMQLNYSHATKNSGSVSNVAASICSQLGEDVHIFYSFFNYHSEIWTSNSHIFT